VSIVIDRMPSPNGTRARFSNFPERMSYARKWPPGYRLYPGGGMPGFSMPSIML